MERHAKERLRGLAEIQRLLRDRLMRLFLDRGTIIEKNSIKAIGFGDLPHIISNIPSRRSWRQTMSHMCASQHFDSLCDLIDVCVVDFRECMLNASEEECAVNEYGRWQMTCLSKNMPLGSAFS